MTTKAVLEGLLLDSEKLHVLAQSMMTRDVVSVSDVEAFHRIIDDLQSRTSELMVQLNTGVREAANDH